MRSARRSWSQNSAQLRCPAVCQSRQPFCSAAFPSVRPEFVRTCETLHPAFAPMRQGRSPEMSSTNRSSRASWFPRPSELHVYALLPVCRDGDVRGIAEVCIEYARIGVKQTFRIVDSEDAVPIRRQVAEIKLRAWSNRLCPNLATVAVRHQKHLALAGRAIQLHPPADCTSVITQHDLEWRQAPSGSHADLILQRVYIAPSRRLRIPVPIRIY